MDITEARVFNRSVYINSETGKFSFYRENCFDDSFIDINDVIFNFEPKFINICLCISNSCNLMCDYCFNKSKTNDFMDSSTCINIIDLMIKEFSNCEKYFVDLSGFGEPLLNLKTIIEVSDYCKSKSNQINKEILVSFVSNGVLLTEQIVSILQKHSILFGVSLDGNKYTHDLHRKDLKGNPTYEKIMDNILKIDNRDYVGCAVTISDHVFDLVETIMNLKKYFNTISIKPVRDTFNLTNIKIVKSWINQYDILTQCIINDLKIGKWDVLKCLLNGDDYFGKFIYRCFLGSITLNRCDSMITRYSFDSNRHIFGCPASNEKYTLDNYEFNYKLALRNQIEKFIASCSSCPFKLYCGGECQILLNRENKSNDLMCMFKRELIKYAMYIKLTCEEEYLDLFYEIHNFCLEKESRFGKNKELEEYMKLNPQLSFIEAKNTFDKINKKY